MTLIAIIPLLVALVGAVTYAVSANPKVSELGRIAFFAGLLVTMLAMAGHTIRIG